MRMVPIASKLLPGCEGLDDRLVVLLLSDGRKLKLLARPLRKLFGPREGLHGLHSSSSGADVGAILFP